MITVNIPPSTISKPVLLLTAAYLKDLAELMPGKSHQQNDSDLELDRSIEEDTDDSPVNQEEQQETTVNAGAAFNGQPPAGTNYPVDKRGIPWDARIHAGTKTKTADGNWKNKRGVDEAERQQIEAELLRQPAAPQGGTNVPGGAAIAALNASRRQETADQSDPSPAGNTNAGAAFNGQQEQPAADMTFPQFIQFVTGLNTRKILDLTTINGICREFGVDGIQGLATPDKAEMIPMIKAAIDSRIPQ